MLCPLRGYALGFKGQLSKYNMLYSGLWKSPREVVQMRLAFIFLFSAWIIDRVNRGM